jgi:virginiamycin B lyase
VRRRLTTGAAVASALALTALAGAAQPAHAPNGSLSIAGQAKKCKGVMAKIGGKRVCLAEGRPCKAKYERAYERFGYVCRGGTVYKKPAVVPAAQVVAKIPVGAGPTSIRYLDGSVWVRNNPDGTVSRIDPTTNAVVATIKVGDGEGDIADGDGSIWVASSEPATVSRIDPVTNTVVATIPTGGQGTWGLTSTPGAIWAANHRHSTTEKPTVVRIDTATNRVVWTGRVGIASFDGTGGPFLMTAAFGSVWTQVSNNSEIDRIDPRDNSITRISSYPCDGVPAAVGDAVWFSANCLHALQRVDPATNTIVAKLSYPGNAALVGPIAVDGSFLWATMAPGLLARFDPASGKVVGTWRHPAKGLFDNPAPVTYGDGSVWVTDNPGRRVLRLQPS